MKKIALVLFLFELVLFVWLYDKYPTPMLMGTVSMSMFLVYELLLKKNEFVKKIVPVVCGIALVFFAVMVYLEPSVISFARVDGSGGFSPPNFWQALVAAIIQYFMLIIGFWAWDKAEISEFLTKQRL